MNLIQHIIEPERLFLAWQPSSKENRSRHIIAEIKKNSKNDFELSYLNNTASFEKALSLGFNGYPAFDDLERTYNSGVMDAFMRRLPPRTRTDFPQYLELLRISPNAQFSDFALLGYSGAKLANDNFSIIHPFENVSSTCELLLEIAGTRHIDDIQTVELFIDQEVTFKFEPKNRYNSKAICIEADGKKIGYVNKGLLASVQSWLLAERIIQATIEKLNGTSNWPVIYIYIKISPLRQ